MVLKYIEMNLVSAGLVSDGAAYPWSSASYHLLGKENQTIMTDCLHDSVFSYKDFFYEKEGNEDLEAIRTSAQQDRAWGKPAFLEKLADSLARIVVPRKRGRPRKENK